MQHLIRPRAACRWGPPPPPPPAPPATAGTLTSLGGTPAGPPGIGGISAKAWSAGRSPRAGLIDHPDQPAAKGPGAILGCHSPPGSSRAWTSTARARRLVPCTTIRERPKPGHWVIKAPFGAAPPLFGGTTGKKTRSHSRLAHRVDPGLAVLQGLIKPGRLSSCAVAGIRLDGPGRATLVSAPAGPVRAAQSAIRPPGRSPSSPVGQSAIFGEATSAGPSSGLAGSFSTAKRSVRGAPGAGSI